MANRTNKLNADKILKIEQQVQQFAQHIQKYKKLFLADDGRIDSEEQQQLDALQVRMDQINQRLAELKGGVETNLSPTENVDVELKGSGNPSTKGTDHLFSEIEASRQRIEKLKTSLKSLLQQKGISI